MTEVSTCADCGYGICMLVLPDRCPMCGGDAWVADDRPPSKPADLQAVRRKGDDVTVMERIGIEPMTSGLQSRRSPS